MKNIFQEGWELRFIAEFIAHDKNVPLWEKEETNVMPV